jgi:multidrug resistance efflux pump
MTIHGLTLLLFIQALVDFCFILRRTPALNWLKRRMLLVSPARVGFFGLRSYLSAHLSRRVVAEAMLGYHRPPPGLPLGRALILAAVVVIVGTLSLFMSMEAPPPDVSAALQRIGALPVIADVSGEIHDVYVIEGSFVHVGDPLIQLDTSRLLLKKNSLESRLHFMELDEMKSAPDLARIYDELRQTEIDLDQCTITSPFDGVVAGVGVTGPGQQIVSGTVVALVMPRPKTKTPEADASGVFH